MKLKIKLISIIIAMMAAVIAALTVVAVVHSGDLQKESAFQYARELANSNSKEIQRLTEFYVDYMDIVSMIFDDYENTDVDVRRTRFNGILNSAINQNEDIMGIFTAWLPGSIDGRDEELGQYQSFYTRRRTGNVEYMPAGYDGWEGYLANMVAKKKPVLENPVWRDIYNQGNVPIISIQFPIKSQAGTVVGVVGINWVSTMQAIVDELVEEVYEGQGFGAVYTNSGTIIAHYVKDRVKDNIATNEGENALLGDQQNRVFQSIKNGGENGHAVDMVRYSPATGQNLYLIYQPIVFDYIDTPWCLLLGIPMGEINKPVREMAFFMIAIAAAILAVSAVITFFTARTVVKPILSVAMTLKDIAEGDGDLTRRIDNITKDEVGDLSLYFNKTLDKIKNLVVTIKDEAVELSGIGQDLSSNMTETAAAINEITANIQSIKGRVINQSESVSQTSTTMEHLTSNIKKVDGFVESQTTHVSQGSAAIEQMVANIRSVTDTLVKNSGNVKELREASEIGRAGLQDVAMDIKEIAHESEGLLQINTVMKDIASQTNLLSMNAAIEAAHAGETGKGFAVVAEEIRKLAESSSEQSKTTGNVLKKIKEAIDKISKSTETVLAKFEAIDSSVRTVSEQEENIRSAMEEQGQGSKQVLSGVGEVNDITARVKGGSNEMLEGASQVIRESENLEKMTHEITSGMNEMASGADQINVAVHHVNEISGRNRDGIATLMREVSRFKVA